MKSDTGCAGTQGPRAGALPSTGMSWSRDLPRGHARWCRVSGSSGLQGLQGLQSLSRAVVQDLQSLSRRSRVPGKALGVRLKLDKLKKFNGFLARTGHGWGVKQ